MSALLDSAVRLRLLLAIACLMFAADAVMHGCAHTPAIAACVDRLTPALEAAAGKALARGDYEAAIAAAFADQAACLTVAAVEAAIEGARNLKLDGRAENPAVQTAIELHGQAWLEAHRRR